MGMLTVLYVLCKNQQAYFSLLRAYLHYGVYHRLSELHIRFLFETICEELEKGICFLRKSVIK
jgi:hypothetical protein